MTSEEIDRLKKTKRNGETTAFLCFLVYFLVKALFVVALIKYHTLLDR